MIKRLSIICASYLLATSTQAQDEIELETTIIKGNSELPQILYVVPWQDAINKNTPEQKLVLHSLFGDLFDPVTPPAPNSGLSTPSAKNELR